MSDQNPQVSKERQHFGSRIGFILLSAGCAIGLGNVWKFPMMVGEMGGGSFVLVYLFCLALIGIPVLTMEYAVGRAAQASPVRVYHKLVPTKKPWRAHGYISLAANIVLMMFYTPVAGWILRYAGFAAVGSFETKNAEQIEHLFYTDVLEDPWMMLLFTAIVAIVCSLVCSLSLGGGLEKITKYMMIALMVMLVAIAGYGLTLSGASEGIAFYLKPDFSKINLKIFGAAMCQAMFTLSLGIGCMAIFGSYIGRERSLLGESVNVVVLDTLVALVSGLIIFPACFTFGIQPDSGPGLLFITLPNVFISLPGGRIWGCLFFIFMVFAALSTVIAVYENIIACIVELTGWRRKPTSFVVCLGMIILCIPMILGYNVWSGFRPFGLEGKNIYDLEDFFVTYLSIPLGSLAYILFCTNRFGWGWENYLAEVNEGKGMKVRKGMYVYMRFILPILVLAIFIISLLGYFGIMG